MLHHFYRPDGRLVKLLLFSTLLDKSPLTFIYFPTFKKKSQVSPTRTTKLFGFWYITEHPSATEHFSYEKFISHYSSFVEDISLLNDLWLKLESLDLYRSNSKKPRSLWLDSPTAHKDVSNPITNYPSISKLLKLANSHVEIPDADLDCCNIICHSSDKKSLRLHADDEPTISRTRPIATFSLGAARTVEFVPKGSSHTNVVRSIEAESNSLYVMNAGCQAILQHRV